MSTSVLHSSKNHGRLLLLAGWALLLLGTALVYWPGLGGPFLLDDFGSIAPIGDLGGISDWASFKAFVFGGNAGPTGRPLALLTFLIDATNWPADSWPFKRTNLIIHLINGVLLGWLIQKLLIALDYSQKQAGRIALVSAGLWLLHPFLVSTTLYAVQRMAQLSTLFMLLGLIGHLYARSFVVDRPRYAYLLMSASMGVFTLLAVFSKENGILLPLLIGAMEVTVFASRDTGGARLHRYWLAVFVAMPTAVVFLYLGRIALTQDFFAIHPPREFSIYERVLTQSRLLFDYIHNWFLPKLYTSGIFQDHVQKSTGLFTPWTTAVSIVLHLSIITACLRFRRTLPLLTFSLLFFYIGHLLESTVINLELYFEHRNYMPAALLFVPLVTALADRANTRILVVVGMVGMLLLGGFTRYSATVWSDRVTMVAVAARIAPLSARAQGEHTINLYNARRSDEALAVIGRAIENRPADPFLRMTQMTLHCRLGILNKADFADSAAVVSSHPYDPRSIEIYTMFSLLVVEPACPEISPVDLRSMFTDMLDLPINANPADIPYSQIQYFIGFLDAHNGRREAAMTAFESSLSSRPGAGHAMQMAAVMAGRGFHDEALYLSDKALQQVIATPDDHMQSSHLRASDIRAFQATVRADREASLSEGASD